MDKFLFTVANTLDGTKSYKVKSQQHTTNQDIPNYTFNNHLRKYFPAIKSISPLMSSSHHVLEVAIATRVPHYRIIITIHHS